MSEADRGAGDGIAGNGAVSFIETPEVVFDLGKTGASVLARATERAPWLPADLAALRSRFPIARSAQPFDAAPWYRPAGHRRAFYRRSPESSLLAVKGTEVLAEDAARIAAWVHLKHDMLESPLEQFPLLEHKAPGVLLMEEARSEAAAALHLMERWIESYDGLARTPLPLLVVRWPAAVVDRYREQLDPLLSARARKILDRLLLDGLAAYVYHYPGVSIRATELGARDAIMASGYSGRKRALGSEVDLEAVFRSWMLLVGRILALGFMPVTLSHANAGQMVQMQNAVVDGGFMDMDSVQPIEGMTGDRELATSFWTMIGELAFTVGTFLGGTASRRLEKLLLVQHDAIVVSVYEAVRAVLVEEASKGRRIDPRLREIVLAESPFARVDRLFSLHYP